jgi:glycosyltransferase involved in cell wall biosynthesis
MRLGHLLRPFDRRFERLEAQVRNAQALAARAYEVAQNWPAVLKQVREAPDYEAAYTETEPLVTVRIATYNRADVLLERALPSLFAQTYENWRAVIVGDACTDDTEQRVLALADERISFVNLPFRGPYPDDPEARWRVVGYSAMNEGLRIAEGRWIAALDHDDEFEDNHIEVLLDHARRERAELAYGQLRMIDAKTGQLRDDKLCVWPPREGRFNFLASLAHGGLNRFRYDYNCRFSGEAADANLMRRLWEVGVRFAFVDRPVGTYYHTPHVWP